MKVVLNEKQLFFFFFFFKVNFSSARATGVGVKPVNCLHTVNTAIQLSNMKHLGSIRAAQVYERFQFRSPVIFRLKEKKKGKIAQVPHTFLLVCVLLSIRNFEQAEDLGATCRVGAK